MSISYLGRNPNEAHVIKSRPPESGWIDVTHVGYNSVVYNMHQKVMVSRVGLGFITEFRLEYVRVKIFGDQSKEFANTKRLYRYHRLSPLNGTAPSKRINPNFAFKIKKGVR